MICRPPEPGRDLREQLKPLASSGASKKAKPVVFPPGRSSRVTTPLAMGSATLTKTIGIVRVSPLEGSGPPPFCQDDVGLQPDKLPRANVSQSARVIVAHIDQRLQRMHEQFESLAVEAMRQT